MTSTIRIEDQVEAVFVVLVPKNLVSVEKGHIPDINSESIQIKVSLQRNKHITTGFLLHAPQKQKICL